MMSELPMMRMQVGEFSGTDVLRIVAEIERLTGAKVQLMCGDAELTITDHVKALTIAEPKQLPRESGLPYYRRFERRRY